MQQNVNLSEADRSDEATVHLSLHAQRETQAGTKGEGRKRVIKREARQRLQIKASLLSLSLSLCKLSNSSST